MDPILYKDLIGSLHRDVPCWELMRIFFRRAGFELPPQPGYEQLSRIESPHEFGDLAALGYKTAGIVDSVDVLVDRGKFLTSIERGRVCLVHRESILPYLVSSWRVTR